MTTVRNQIGAGVPPLQVQADMGVLNANSNALTATGSSQGTALALPNDFNIFTTVASSTGCILPSTASPTDEITIVNHGANTLSVYPPTGGKIANGSVNAAFSVAANKTAFVLCLDGTNWAASVSA